MARGTPRLAGVAAAALPVASPTQAPAATSTLDQSSDGPAQGYLGTIELQTQTFTAGRGGALDRETSAPSSSTSSTAPPDPLR